MCVNLDFGSFINFKSPITSQKDFCRQKGLIISILKVGHHQPFILVGYLIQLHTNTPIQFLISFCLAVLRLDEH